LSIDDNELENAQKLFEAYTIAVGGIAYNGEPIPGWDKISEKARNGWVAAWNEALRLIDS
jgi:hypothetical protein